MDGFSDLESLHARLQGIYDITRRNYSHAEHLDPLDQILLKVLGSMDEISRACFIQNADAARLSLGRLIEFRFEPQNESSDDIQETTSASYASSASAGATPEPPDERLQNRLPPIRAIPSPPPSSRDLRPASHSPRAVRAPAAATPSGAARRRAAGVRHYREGAMPSTHCHLCCRSAGAAAVACANLRRGTCRKVVCARCFRAQGWDWAAAAAAAARDAPAADAWVCCHCRRACPARAQCFTYRRANERRRLHAAARRSLPPAI